MPRLSGANDRTLTIHRQGGGAIADSVDAFRLLAAFGIGQLVVGYEEAQDEDGPGLDGVQGLTSGARHGSPAGVVRLVRDVAVAHGALQLAEVLPRVVVLQPRVQEGLVHGEALALLDLQQVVDEINCWNTYL